MASKGNFSSAPWLLFLFSPISALIGSIQNIRSRWAKNVFWAFVIFYGATFAIAKEDALSIDAQSDIHRYREQIEDLYELDLSFRDIRQMYVDNPDVDILRLTIAIIVSRFTKSQQILTSIYAFIYGYFLSRNLWIVFEQLHGKLKPSVKFMLFVLFLILPFWFINGFRFWTATQIFIYGQFLYFFRGRIYGHLISSLTFLIHFSFLLPAALLIIFFLLRKMQSLLFIFYLLSLLYSQVNIAAFNTFLEQNLGEKLQERTKTYRDEESVKLYRKGELDPNAKNANWYVKLYSEGLTWVLRLMIVFIFLRVRKDFIKNSFLSNIFSMTILLFSVGNIMSSIPSGTRWLALSSFFSITFLIILLQNNFIAYRKLNLFLLLSSPFFLLFFIVSIRIAFFSLSVNTFIGNPFTALFTDYNISLNDLIKQ